MRIGNVAALALFAVVMPIASHAQPRTGLPPADVTRINEVTESFTKAVLAKDWKALAALYVEDGVLYPPGETAVKGRAAIEACVSALPPTKEFTLRNTRVDGQDDLAYVQGTYTMTIATPGKSEPDVDSGYYLEIRRRQPDGRWLIAVHMLTPHR